MADADSVCSDNFTICGRRSAAPPLTVLSVWITCRRFPHVFNVVRGHPWMTSKMSTNLKLFNNQCICLQNWGISDLPPIRSKRHLWMSPLEKNKEAAQEGDRWTRERERRLNFTAHLVVRAQKIAFLSPQLTCEQPRREEAWTMPYRWSVIQTNTFNHMSTRQMHQTM